VNLTKAAYIAGFCGNDKIMEVVNAVPNESSVAEADALERSRVFGILLERNGDENFRNAIFGRIWKIIMESSNENNFINLYSLETYLGLLATIDKLLEQSYNDGMTRI